MLLLIFRKRLQNNKITVEEIQDSVENVLIQAGYADVAKAYILYQAEGKDVRNMKSTILDYKEIVNSYVKSRLESEGELYSNLFCRRP